MGDIRRLSPPGLKEDLEPVEEETKNWKGIIISLLVISTICSFILLSIVLLTPKMGEQKSREMLKLEDFILEGYEVRHYNGTWISSNELLFKNNNGSLCIYDINTKLTNNILDGALIREYETQEYSLSSDRQSLLLVHDVKKTGTFSRTARYTVFDIKLNTFTPLKVKDDSNSDQHQSAQWVPNTSLIVVVHRNNIYLFNHFGEIQEVITQTGKEDLIYNGVTDMSYEEHILYSSRGFWINSYLGGWAILYMSIDATKTDKIPYIYYGKQNNDSQQRKDDPYSYEMPYNLNEEELAKVGLKKSTNGNAYPRIMSFPYPKAGKQMPKLTMHMTKFNERNEIVYRDQIVRPGLDRDQEAILSSEPVWLSAHEFRVIWMRREQDIAIISRCREKSSEWHCERITEQKMLRPGIGSLVINTPPYVPLNNEKMFVILPVNEGISGSFEHIAMVTPDGKKQFLTHGSYVVTKIFHYNSENRTIYYSASSPGEPGTRHIYALTHQNNANERKNIRCLSCSLNSTCAYADAKFSPSGNNFILECLGPDAPVYYLYDTLNERVIDILDNSTKLRNWAQTRLMPKTRHLSIFVSPTQYTIHIQLNIPANVNEFDDAKYPLVIETAKHPGMQISDYINKLDWSRYLSSRREYVTARIDTRGSANQGDRNMFSIYKRVGELEIEDLKTALKYLKELPYIDHSKIAVWGQEYGGYISASFLAHEKTVACGVAISPITSWKNYLAIQAERFMGKPDENFLGYEKTELMKSAHLLKGRTFLIVHGTVDKRVSLQHSMQLIKSLTNNAVQFQTQFYPDSGSLETWDLFVRYHFYRTMEDFFARCFKVEDEEDEDDILPITKVIKGRVRGAR